MRASRRVCPQVLTLEGRALMSATPLHDPSSAAQVARHGHSPGHSHPITLRGGLKNLVTADHKGVVQISGSGHLAGLGRVTLASTFDTHGQTPLLSTPWLLHADVVIASPKGKVNVRISPGTIGMNPFAQPVHLQYSVRGGTGEYRKASGSGLVDLTLGQPIPTTLSQLKQMGNQLESQGIPFTLYFHPGHRKKWGDFSDFWYKVIQTTVKSHGPDSSRPGTKHGGKRPG